MVIIPVTYPELLAHKAAGRIATNNVFYTVPHPGRSDFNAWAAFSVDSSRVFHAHQIEVPETFAADFPEAVLVETLNLG